jgi:hypothetical protein
MKWFRKHPVLGSIAVVLLLIVAVLAISKGAAQALRVQTVVAIEQTNSALAARSMAGMID